MTVGASYGPRLTAADNPRRFDLHAPRSIMRDLGLEQRAFVSTGSLARLALGIGLANNSATRL